MPEATSGVCIRQKKQRTVAPHDQSEQDQSYLRERSGYVKKEDGMGGRWVSQAFPGEDGKAHRRGVEYPLFSAVRLGASGGYAFARKFEFDGGTRDDLKVHGTPFGRLEVKCTW